MDGTLGYTTDLLVPGESFGAGMVSEGKGGKQGQDECDQPQEFHLEIKENIDCCIFKKYIGWMITE